MAEEVIFHRLVQKDMKNNIRIFLVISVMMCLVEDSSSVEKNVPRFEAVVLSVEPEHSRRALLTRKRWAIRLKEVDGEKVIKVHVESPTRFLNADIRKVIGTKVAFEVGLSWNGEKKYFGKD